MHLEHCEQLTVTTSVHASAYQIKPTDICGQQNSILTTLGVANSLKLCVGKNKPLILLCNSSNTVFGFSVFGKNGKHRVLI
jgi:hypothetical protein